MSSPASRASLPPQWQPLWQHPTKSQPARKHSMGALVHWSQVTHAKCIHETHTWYFYLSSACHFQPKDIIQKRKLPRTSRPSSKARRFAIVTASSLLTWQNRRAQCEQHTHIPIKSDPLHHRRAQRATHMHADQIRPSSPQKSTKRATHMHANQIRAPSPQKRYNESNTYNTYACALSQLSQDKRAQRATHTHTDQIRPFAKSPAPTSWVCRIWDSKGVEGGLRQASTRMTPFRSVMIGPKAPYSVLSCLQSPKWLLSPLPAQVHGLEFRACEHLP